MCSINCYSCESACESQNVILCMSGHSMCETCSEVYLNMCISEPDINIPMKCKCSDAYEFETIKQISILFKIEERIDNLLIKNCLLMQKDNGDIIECPFCEYMELRDLIGINFIFCKNNKCNKITCYYCHLECKEDEENEIMKHFECASNERIKSQIDQAIENGSKVNCPYFDTSGRKNEDDCTHITCIKCDHKFCYVCGLAIQYFNNFDQNADDTYNFSNHNEEWQSNDQNCPMYFNYEIYERDNRWPKSDNESDLLDFFHRKKILKNLRDIFEKEDLDLIKELETKYKWLEKADLTIDKIMNEDLVLIKRSDCEE
jgi:hypothetical protein